MTLRTRTIDLQSVLGPDAIHGHVTIGRASAQPRHSSASAAAASSSGVTRVAAANNLFLPDRTVSKKHAQLEIVRHDDLSVELSIADSGSHHGTVLGNHLLAPDVWHRVNKGDLIGLVSVAKDEKSSVATESCKFLVRYDGCADDALTFTVLSKEEIASLRAKKESRDGMNPETSVLIDSGDDDDYVLEDHKDRSTFMNMSASASVSPFGEEEERDDSSLFGEEEDDDDQCSISISISDEPHSFVGFDDDVDVDVETVLFDDDEEPEEQGAFEVAHTSVSLSCGDVEICDEDEEDVNVKAHEDLDDDDEFNNTINSDVNVSTSSAFEDSTAVSHEGDSSSASASASASASISVDDEDIPNTPTEESKTIEVIDAPVFKPCSLDSLLNGPETTHGWKQQQQQDIPDEILYPPIKLIRRSKSTGLSQETTYPHPASNKCSPKKAEDSKKKKVVPDVRITKVKTLKKSKKAGISSGAKKEILTGLVGFAVGMTMGAGLTFSTLASLGKSMGA